MSKKKYERVKYYVDQLAIIISKLVPKSNNLQNSLKHIGIEVKYFCDDNYLAFIQYDYNVDEPIIAVNASMSKCKRQFIVAEELADLIIVLNWLPINSKLHPNPEYNVLDSILTHPKIPFFRKTRFKNRKFVFREFARMFLAPNIIKVSNNINLKIPDQSNQVKKYLN